MQAADIGRTLGERHRTAAEHGTAADKAEFDPSLSLLNYGEFPHEGDWTLRSALVRLAQPEPARVGAVLELVRRLDAPLHHVKRALEQHLTTCDRDVTVDNLAGAPLDPYRDIRTADLARLLATGVDDVELLAGYEQQTPLDHEERVAVPLLAVAVQFEWLAQELTAWALAGSEPPPIASVDRAVADVGAELDRLSVPVETGPPQRSGRSARS
ncbi:MAG: hypothetical protein ACRBK7_16745 [Acidimicrobiales bacterium]